MYIHNMLKGSASNLSDDGDGIKALFSTSPYELVISVYRFSSLLVQILIRQL